MNNNLFITFLFGFILSTLLFVLWIPMLRKLKIGQTIRADGPSEHLKKNGTPTMGGLIVLIAFTCTFVFASVFILNLNFNELLFCVFPLFCYGGIGLIDDILIIAKHSNKGVKPLTKVLMQLISVSMYYFIFNKNFNTNVDIGLFQVDLHHFYYLFIVLIFVSTTNAVNLTDGLDGLACGLLIISFIGTFILGLLKKNQIVCYYSTCIIASLLGFLMFNHYPAKIFMGNIGSMMLGASLATLMVILDEEMLLLIIAFVFIIETISVIVQVVYFKISHGKRFFKMAPLHHHFEQLGYTEWQIDFIFWMCAIVALVFSLIMILM